jgi:hypothetical protein
VVKLFSPDNEIELALIRSLLDGAAIPYFVHNDHFGTMRIGPRIDLLNKKTVMVPPLFVDQARQVLADFLEMQAQPDGMAKPVYSLADKLRMVFETLIFGWFVPGPRRTQTSQTEEPEGDSPP